MTASVSQWCIATFPHGKGYITPLFYYFYHIDQKKWNQLLICMILSAPTQAEFLFQVLIGIGMVLRVGTPYSRVLLQHLEAVKARRKCGSVCLLMSLKL